MKNPKKYYIIKRYNPQFANPYYIGKGQLSKTDVKRYEKPGYGVNYVLSYDTELEYRTALEILKENK